MTQLDLIQNIFSNVSIHMKLNLFCRHDKGWTEHKTKADYTLWCVAAGSMTIETEGKAFPVFRGDAVLFYPGDSYRACSDEGCSFLVFFFSLETGNSIDLLKDLNLAGVYRDAALQEQCLTFCGRYQQTSAASPGLPLYAAFFSFFTELFQRAENCLHFHETASPAPDTLLRSLVAYMNAHYTEPVAIRELAEMAEMSEKYFIRYFHFHIGVTPKQYLVKLRMRRAVELLSSDGRSLSEIADALGYSDQYCFSKAFRKYYGEAPGTFRRHT